MSHSHTLSSRGLRGIARAIRRTEERLASLRRQRHQMIVDAQAAFVMNSPASQAALDRLLDDLRDRRQPAAPAQACPAAGVYEDHFPQYDYEFEGGRP
jgi:hypothetical protein